MPKKILVTGGLGFLGTSLVRALVKSGKTVRVLDNSSRGSKEKLGQVHADVEIVEGDIRDPAIAERAVHGVESVHHLAYVNGTEYFYKYPAYVLDVAVKGMVNVLDSCIKHNVRECILASSSEVYQSAPIVPTDETTPLSIPDVNNPRYCYGGGKIICELMALNYGRQYFERVVIFRPHNVYGPAMGYEHVIPQFIGRLQSLAGSTKNVELPIQGDGKQTRAFIYIDDFTQGLLTVIDKGEHLNIYNIGTQEEVSIGTLAQMVGQGMGLSLNIVPGEEAKGGTQRRVPDITKLRNLGFRVQTSLEAGLKPTVEWYTAHPVPSTVPAKKSPPLFIP